MPNKKYGEPDPVTLKLRAGTVYRLGITHVSTNPEYNGSPNPDLDYTFDISLSKASDGMILLVQDPGGILGYHNDNEWASLTGKSATIRCARACIVSDRDRNGVIESGDDTPAVRPLRMWIKDDADTGDTAAKGSDVPGMLLSNAADPAVNGRRDLFAFFPVWLDIHELLAALPVSISGVQCRLRHAHGVTWQMTNAVNAVFTSIPCSQVGEFLGIKEVTRYGRFFRQHAHEADTTPVTSEVTYAPPPLREAYARKPRGRRGPARGQGRDRASGHPAVKLPAEGLGYGMAFSFANARMESRVLNQ